MNFGFTVKKLQKLAIIRRVGMLFCLVAVFGVATYQRNFIWKDDLSLWSDVVKKSSNKARPYNNLGIAYQGICRYDNAIAEYKKTLQGARQPYFAEVYNNLGVCYFNKGWIDMAIKEFRRALNINPDFSNAGFNLRIALTRIKNRAQD